MRQYEYRIEKIEFKDKKKPRQEQILGVLNELGQDGWEVCSLSVEPRTAANEGHLSVLLKKKM
jgi:hypothetical protein